MARNWSLVSDSTLVRLERRQPGPEVRATTPAVVRPSSWSELMAWTCAVVRAPTSSVEQRLDGRGVEASQGAGGDGAQVGGFEFADLGGRQGGGLVRRQRRELGRTQRVEAGRGEVVDLLESSAP